MDGDDGLDPQVFRHAKYIHRGHLVGQPWGILPEGGDGHVNLVLLAMAQVVVGKMGVAAVIEAAGV